MRVICLLHAGERVKAAKSGCHPQNSGELDCLRIGNEKRVEVCECERGYVFDVWDTYLGKSFTTKYDRSNQHDNNVTLAIIGDVSYHIAV